MANIQPLLIDKSFDMIGSQQEDSDVVRILTVPGMPAYTYL